MSFTTDSKEGQYVTTCNVPGAIIHADIDEVIHMRKDGAIYSDPAGAAGEIPHKTL